MKERPPCRYLLRPPGDEHPESLAEEAGEKRIEAGLRVQEAVHLVQQGHVRGQLLVDLMYRWRRETIWLILTTITLVFVVQDSGQRKILTWSSMRPHTVLLNPQEKNNQNFQSGIRFSIL